MLSENDPVSIGMPVFNDVQFLERALNSIRAQTFQEWTLLISDDCSSDGSELICRKYAALDNRIRYVRQKENIGISRNMKFLLENSTGKYFMWAANDDLWHPDFIRVLKEGLDNNPDAVSSFCAYVLIDETDQVIPDYPQMFNDYSAEQASARLFKLFRNANDGFGYGLFRREQIQEVSFPVWWWINRKCAYNNIYPSLCFYLSRGNIALCKDRALWYNRIKKESNVNHKVPYPGSFVKGWLAFSLRRFNLVITSFSAIRKGKDLALAIYVLPGLFFRWFILSSINELRMAFRKYRSGEKRFI